MTGYAARDYPTLMGALLARKRALGLTNLDVDARGGLPDGYAAKLFCGVRTIGLVNLGRLLAALEVELVVAAAAYPSQADGNMNHVKPLPRTSENCRAWGRKGGIRRAIRLNPKRRSMIAAMGGRARALALKLRKASSNAAEPRYEAAPLRKLKDRQG